MNRREFTCMVAGSAVAMVSGCAFPPTGNLGPRPKELLVDMPAGINKLTYYYNDGAAKGTHHVELYCCYPQEIDLLQQSLYSPSGCLRLEHDHFLGVVVEEAGGSVEHWVQFSRDGIETAKIMDRDFPRKRS